MSLIRQREKKDFIDRYLLLRVVVIGVLFAFMIENIIRLSEVEAPIKSFDPYETLGVDITSTVPEIKPSLLSKVQTTSL